MFDIEFKKSFTTVGELRELLENWGDDTPVSICGEIVGWFHADTECTGITLDYSELEDSYE